MIRNFFEASRSTKRAISVIYDCLAILAAIYISTLLRYGFPPEITQERLLCAATTLTVSIYLFVKLGLYRAILRYINHQALLAVIIGTGVSSITLAATSFFYSAAIPRSIPVIYFFIALLFTGLPRLAVRGLVHTLQQKTGEAVIIYGAGSCGHQLCAELQSGNLYRPVAFVDDDKKLRKSSVRGLPVEKPDRLERLVKQLGVKKILLAISNLPPKQRQKIVTQLAPIAVQIKTVPTREDLLTGKAQISQLVDLDIADLLGRAQVNAKEHLLDSSIKNKVVLVTGAGGSIGSELCRQIIKRRPSRLILLESNELSLYQIERELETSLINEVELVFTVGSVQDAEHIRSLITLHQVDSIFHAAAYKHVPLMESNVIAAVKNNVFGTIACAETAAEEGIETFVLVSTDKAVRPTNVMGASKRVAELALQALAQKTGITTKFTMVRFGNVLGSSGSVVPLFKEQIQAGGPVTVTHPDVTRYFMTIPEAAELVLQASNLGEGGDVFVLDMGEPIKIVDLAERMIQLSGHQIKNEDHPNGDIEIRFTGLRVGEKLYEELLVGDNVEGTEHPRIMRAEEFSLTPNEMQNLIARLKLGCEDNNPEAIRDILECTAIGYTPETTTNSPNKILANRNNIVLFDKR